MTVRMRSQKMNLIKLFNDMIRIDYMFFATHQLFSFPFSLISSSPFLLHLLLRYVPKVTQQKIKILGSFVALLLGHPVYPS